MSFTVSCRPGREPEELLPPPLWNGFSKQMSKRKISCLTTFHPSCARDRNGEGLLSLRRVRGQPGLPCPGSGGEDDIELELSLDQKPVSPWDKWGHRVEVSTSCYPENCIYRDSWSWRAEEEFSYGRGLWLGGAPCTVQGNRAKGTSSPSPRTLSLSPGPAWP